MKSIKYKKYGPPQVLSIVEEAKPVPKDNEVLIKMHATTVTNADCMMRRADTFMSRLVIGILRPRRRYRILGTELSGEIEEVGKLVERFKKGDKVLGFTGFKAGAYAEYKCLSERTSIDIMPKGLSFGESAALVDGCTTALFFYVKK